MFLYNDARHLRQKQKYPGWVISPPAHESHIQSLFETFAVPQVPPQITDIRCWLLPLLSLGLLRSQRKKLHKADSSEKSHKGFPFDRRPIELIDTAGGPKKPSALPHTGVPIQLAEVRQ